MISTLKEISSRFNGPTDRDFESTLNWQSGIAIPAFVGGVTVSCATEGDNLIVTLVRSDKTRRRQVYLGKSLVNDYLTGWKANKIPCSFKMVEPGKWVATIDRKGGAQ